MNEIIMFVDTGIDDAVAIILSAFDHRTKLKAIVACKGNTTLADVTDKTLQVLEFIKKDIPVYKGFNGRLSKGLDVEGIHGPKGKLGGFDFPKPTTKAKSFSEFLKMFESLDKKVDILCISPITTLAKMLLDNPKLKEKICHVYFQAGLLEDPNYVGFNVGYDAKAVEVILQSGIKLVVCPSDFGHKAYLSHRDVQKLKSYGKTGEMLEYVFRSYYDRDVGDKGVATHDGCVSFLVRHWGFFLMKKSRVFVEYNKNGFGILKFDFKSKQKNAWVCKVMYKPRFKRFVFRVLKKAK